MLYIKPQYKTDNKVKRLVKAWVENSALGTNYLMRKSLKVQDWIHEFDKSSYMMDEMCVYILSRIMGSGIGIILKNSIWTTKKTMI